MCDSPDRSRIAIPARLIVDNGVLCWAELDEVSEKIFEWILENLSEATITDIDPEQAMQKQICHTFQGIKWYHRYDIKFNETDAVYFWLEWRGKYAALTW